MSPKWEAKFTDVAQQFVRLRDEIKFDLQLHTSVGITTINADVSEVKEMVGNLMRVVFERMQSSEERDVASLVAAQPGGREAVLKDDVLLGKVLAAHELRNRKGRGAKRYGAGAEEDKARMIAKLRRKVNKDVEQVLADNKCFDKWLEDERIKVNKVDVSTRRETDRVIDAPVGGLEGIIDRVSPGPSSLGGSV